MTSPTTPTTPTTPTPPPPPPVERTRGNWTYYDAGQGLSQDIQDVSADEGGNVYVAGGDAVYVKKKADDRFLRFDAKNAGLTETCNDLAYIDPANIQYPPTPPYLCRVISVAGAAPGAAIIGYKGFSQKEGDLGYERDQWAWAVTTGGADVVAFDPDKGTLTKARHVWIASPPGIVCHADGTERAATGCSDPTDPWWNSGRALVRRIERIVVNHDRSSPMYGDVWLGGNHAVFSVLLANAAARGYPDKTAAYDGIRFGHSSTAFGDWSDAKDVWEHVHPVISPNGSGLFLDGEGYALSIDPRSGMVWGSNEFRTAYVTGYGPNLANDQWWMGPLDASVVNDQPSWYVDVWPDPKTPTDPADPNFVLRFTATTRDDVRSVSHCPDGSLWVGSTTHGLARIDTGSFAVTHVELPNDGLGGVTAVACDPKDGSLWIGRGLRDWSYPDDFVIVGGGLQRYRNGTFETIDTTGLPEFANHAVNSIQIDRWSTPRVLYFAFHPTVDKGGKITAEGGVASYDGD